MTLNEFYSEVSRRADTAGTQINVADVSRVCSKFFEVLNGMPTNEVLILIARGLHAVIKPDIISE